MGSFLRSQHELVPIFKAGNAKHKNNVQLGRHGRNRSNVWQYPSVGAFARKTEEGSLLALHPTAKPVRLVADAILDSSDANDVVFDPFLGSGTTLIAAERTRRRCFAIEIDPLYVDTAVRRWQSYSGLKASRIGGGELFDELEQNKND
jgi:DNA modification methylase